MELDALISTSGKLETLNEARFDEYGRCIPVSLKAQVHNESRRYFSVVQPKVDYSEIYQRFDKYLAIGGQISLGDFKQRAEAIMAFLGNLSGYENITQGVGVPFILPKSEKMDIGQAFEGTYLRGVQQSFDAMFPAHSFTSHCQSSLDGILNITPGSRHESVINAIQKDVVVGYYFPCLLEYSKPAAIEQLATLSDNFLLAGGFDTAAAIIGSPDLLLRKDGYPPLLWLSGLEGGGEKIGYHFEAYGYDLTFNRRVHFDQAAEYWASGLVVLG